MSTKISLIFTEEFDTELMKKGVDLQIIRLRVKMRFEVISGWTEPYEAIIDTGAPVSLIPREIWKDANIAFITKYQISGVVPKKECILPVNVGNISCVLLDEKQRSRKFTMLSYLADTNRIPLILGFRDILSRCDIYFNYEKKKAFLEI